MGGEPLFYIALAIGFALVPMVLSVGTSYLKVSIVLSLVRNGLGAGQVPSVLITGALSLAITIYVMEPVVSESMKAIPPLDLTRGSGVEFIQTLPLSQMIKPWRTFFEAHTGVREEKFLHQLRKAQKGEQNMEEEGDLLSFGEMLLAFILTELREAFLMGLFILIPFLAIDLMVSAILTGMGMFMVSPVLISLPLKLFLFAYSDGWIYLIHGLIKSYR